MTWLKCNCNCISGDCPGWVDRRAGRNQKYPPKPIKRILLKLLRHAPHYYPIHHHALTDAHRAGPRRRPGQPQKLTPPRAARARAHPPPPPPTTQPPRPFCPGEQSLPARRGVTPRAPGGHPEVPRHDLPRRRDALRIPGGGLLGQPAGLVAGCVSEGARRTESPN